MSKNKEENSPVKAGLKSKEDIVHNWLPRYTGRPLDEFGEYILLTNFSKYLHIFSEMHDNAPIYGTDKPMQSVTAAGITIINFGMGSPMAATIMDLLSAIAPKAVLFLGKAGGLKKKNKIGDLVLPIAAIRGEGTSNDYFPLKYPLCRLLLYRKRYPPLSGIIHVTTGQEQCIQPTDACGNMRNHLRNISNPYVPCV